MDMPLSPRESYIEGQNPLSQIYVIGLWPMKKMVFTRGDNAHIR